MRTATKLVVGLLGKRGGNNLLDAYFETTIPIVRYRLEETSGTTITNSGSLGASGNATVSGTYTLGVDSGTLGARLGVECDGATTAITCTNTSAASGLSALTLLTVWRSDTDGEGSSGIIFSKLNEWVLRMGGIARVVFERNSDLGGSNSALAITNFNAFAHGTVYAVAARIDTDGIPHIFINGVETTYSTQRTLVGSPASVVTNLLAASISGVATFDGGIYDVAVVEGALTDEQILAHYEATFLSTVTSTLGVAFVGTSITEASPTGYRPLTQNALQTGNTSTRFFFPGSYWGGGKTWEILFALQDDIISKVPNVIVCDLIGTNNTTTGRAEIEGLIRRLRTGLPQARIVLLIMPSFNSTSDSTNAIATLNADTRTLADYYDCTYVDWTAKFYEYLGAGTYTQADLYADIVHPANTGYARISDLLLETLTLGFINSPDPWTGDLADYTYQYDDGTFNDVANYTQINGIDCSVTGTWTTVNGTGRTSSTADSTIQFSGTFQSWGIQTSGYSYDSEIGVTIDGGAEVVSSTTFNRPRIRWAYVAEGAHTITIRLVSGSLRVDKILLI